MRFAVFFGFANGCTHWVKRVAHFASGQTTGETTTTTSAILGGTEQSKKKKQWVWCARGATPGTCDRRQNASSVMPVGTGGASLIPTATEIQTMTSVQEARTGKPKEKPVVKMYVQQIWMQRQTELEEKARCGASFKTTCVRSTEYYKLADDGPSENGRPTKEEVQK